MTEEQLWISLQKSLGVRLLGAMFGMGGGEGSLGPILYIQSMVAAQL